MRSVVFLVRKVVFFLRLGVFFLRSVVFFVRLGVFLLRSVVFFVRLGVFFLRSVVFLLRLGVFSLVLGEIKIVALRQAQCDKYCGSILCVVIVSREFSNFSNFFIFGTPPFGHLPFKTGQAI